MEFKQHLDRQEHTYAFFRTSFGRVFDLDRMKSHGGSQGSERCVQLSLWPGLAKCIADTTLITVPEVVATGDVKKEKQADQDQAIGPSLASATQGPSKDEPEEQAEPKQRPLRPESGSIDGSSGSEDEVDGLSIISSIS
ncbi:hypothetical protein BBP40_010970 [Aspergillus hancockii]|nr:hypothetical protein BBP40_010970 [Aspergillus hancockii]